MYQRGEGFLVIDTGTADIGWSDLVDIVHVMVLCRAYASSPEVLDLPKLLIIFMYCTGTGIVLCRAFASPDVRDLAVLVSKLLILFMYCTFLQSLR
jgi:ABC-type polysaccharide/polyol phosphate export permease